MKLELKRIPIWPAVRISFFLNLILGFIIGLLMAVLWLPLMLLPGVLEGSGKFGEIGLAFGFVALLLPFIYAIVMAVLNTILVAIAAFAYNLIAGWVGGFQFEYDRLDDTPVRQVPDVNTTS